MLSTLTLYAAGKIVLWRLGWHGGPDTLGFFVGIFLFYC